MNCLTVTLLAVLLMPASGLARAESLERGEAAAGTANESSSLVISPTPFADDFMARTQAGRGRWSAVVAEAAAANGLPPDFLMRLVAQESGFNPSSVSKAGALGIAQFMPGTALSVGLSDPFDPVEAIPAAAKHLGDLRSRFGNLGLAAAAYNAGAGRVTAWLAGRGNLPLETVNYVRAVTGRNASEWVPTGLPAAGAEMSQQPSRTPAAGRTINVGKRTASATALCQAINSASSPCIVRQNY
jgi:hypothetical protein